MAHTWIPERGRLRRDDCDLEIGLSYILNSVAKEESKTRAGEIIQWIKNLGNKSEDLSLSPWAHLKNPDMVACVCNPNAPMARWEAGTGESAAAGKPASLAYAIVNNKETFRQAEGD